MTNAYMSADRLIIRQDHKQQPVVYLADSLTGDDTISVWRPGSAQPHLTDLRTYHLSKPLPEKEVEKLASVYQKTFGRGEVQIMQRLPRVLYDAPKLKAVKNEQQEEIMQTKPAPAKPIEDIIATTWGMSQPKVQQSFVIRKTGDFWKLLAADGSVVAYAVDEQDALEIMKSLLGNEELVH